MSAAPKRWNEISLHLDHALTLSDEERAAWLVGLRERDVSLANEIESLLNEHRALSEEGFLERVPLAMQQGSSLAGQKVGPYTLTEPIGEGGMSTVWAAERADGRFEGRVAVKFLNFALHGPTGQMRFAREGSILGRLAHPHIAHLMDAGVSLAGQPYLVLEYVEGEQIDRYCETKQLSVDARLRLFLDVLSAVAHAHANLIVHRDLKPSNVLVQHDGQVKLLDFGIAKLLDDEQQAASATLLTREGGAALTPLYAAPEQLTGGCITTATDVYALGVLLYVLLTGHHPTARAERSAAELVHAITITEPPRMSDAVADTLEGEKLRRALRGDLDTIVAKALKKEPGERYSSAIVLADDIRRSLHHEPIGARPDTLVYRTAKFARRNRVPVILASIMVFAIAGGVASTVVQARTAKAQRDFAFRQLSRAEAINDLQNYVLSNVGPGGKPFTIGDVLSRAEHVVRREQVDPATRVRLLISIGGQYKSADRYQKAQQLLEEAYRLSKDLPEPALRASAACRLGQVVSRQGDLSRAEGLWREGLNALPDDALYTLERISCWLRGSEIAYNADRPEDAVDRALTARRLLAQSRVRSDPDDLDSTIVLASAYDHAGNRGKAVATYQMAEDRLKSLGRDDTEQAAGMFNNWALTLVLAGQPLQAESLLRRTINIERDGSGENSISSTTLGNYGFVLYQLGRLDEAAHYAEQAYDRAVTSGDDTAADQALLHRARIYRAKGDLARSGQMLTQARARMEHKFAPRSVPMAVLTGELASNAQAAGQLANAKGLADEAMSAMETLAKSGHPSKQYESRILLRRAEIALQLGHADAAFADASRALALSEALSVPGGSSADVGHAYLALGRALNAQGKANQAKAALRSAAENLEATLGQDNAEAAVARRLLEFSPR